MTGTEKQVKWAEEIKKKMLEKLIPYLHKVVTKDAVGDTEKTQKANIINLCEEVLRCDDARIWIETIRYYTAEDILVKGQKGKKLSDLKFCG